MRIAHFDCFSGISGDMTLAALIDSGVDPEAIRAAIDSFGLPVTLEIEKVKRNGIAATYVKVACEDQENHRHLKDVYAILEKGAITDRQRELAKRIFRKLAEAEAKVHGMSVEKVHFHEVGALDSIADIAGAAVGLDLLGVEKFTSRSVPPGSGTVKCEHGIMPVPAPATAELLKGVPLAMAPVVGELVTPTGAAILTTLVTEYTDQPAMTVERIGWGAGKRDFWEQPNCLRLLVGHSAETPAGFEQDVVWLLETNLDDVPGETIGYAMERLFAAGALDVFTTPIQMKKNRPGTLLAVLCELKDREGLESVLFRETGTLGVRRSRRERSKLHREIVTVETPWGPVRAKRGSTGEKIYSFTPEYEDCARIARGHGLSLAEVHGAVGRLLRS